MYAVVDLSRAPAPLLLSFTIKLQKIVPGAIGLLGPHCAALIQLQDKRLEDAHGARLLPACNSSALLVHGLTMMILLHQEHSIFFQPWFDCAGCDLVLQQCVVVSTCFGENELSILHQGCHC